MYDFLRPLSLNCFVGENQTALGKACKLWRRARKVASIHSQALEGLLEQFEDSLLAGHLDVSLLRIPIHGGVRILSRRGLLHPMHYGLKVS